MSELQVLFTDAADLVGGKLIGVVDSDGQLLATHVLGPTPTNLAEMEAVVLATNYMSSPYGVVLTDSLDAVKFLGGNSSKHPYSKQLDELLALRRRLEARWPAGWVIAWIPDRQNRAHRPLSEAVRHTSTREQSNV